MRPAPPLGLIPALWLWTLTLWTTALWAAPELRTEAERSGFLRTGRYAEVIKLCAAFQRQWPRAVRCERFGTSPEGRPMQLLVVSTRGVFTPAAARRAGLPVLLVQGGIHAGEIDGKDAGFLLLREVLEGKVAAGALDRQVLLFVPVFSVDGHERFKAWNRPNQRGPEEMGWRTTAQNYNLNRDYAKADAPEMQAMLALVQRWDPLLTVDLHVTNGAQFQHDVSIQVEPQYAGDPALMRTGRVLGDAVRADLRKAGSLPLAFYPSFVEGDNPASGIVDSVAPPRFSTGYFWLRNRYAMLVETHAWKDYPTRVRITRNTVLSVLEQMAAHGRAWQAEAHAADARAAALGGELLPLDYAATEHVREIDFQGYAYTRTPSAISGGLVTRYDETRPEVWRMPLRDEVVPGQQVRAPSGGYVVPPAHAARVQHWLDTHGIRWQRIESSVSSTTVEQFRSQRWTLAASSSEGRQRLSLQDGDWASTQATLSAGSLYVPIAQPLARLVVALLEPRAPDSLLAWGEFNAVYEQKEYMEAYVAEDVAQALLDADPALATEFQQRLASDPAFAASPAQRLDFFYRRHSAWDDRLGVYPILRVAQTPE